MAALGLSIPMLGCEVDEEPAIPVETEQQEIIGAFFAERTARSGRRLTAEYLVSRDGARLFSQFRDTKLDTPCNFAQTETGEIACFPEFALSLKFSDPECTQPVVAVTLTSTTSAASFVPPTAISESVRDSQCGDFDSDFGFRAYKVGRSVDGPPNVYFVDPNVGCRLDDFTNENPSRVFEISRLPTSKLVRGRPGERFAGGFRLKEQVIHGSDGSRSPFNQSANNFRRQYVDTWLRKTVSPVTTSQGPGSFRDVVWAEGTASQSSSQFIDSACTQPAARFSGCQPKSRVLVGGAGAILDEEACRFDFQLAEGGSAIDGTSTFLNFGGSCFPSFFPSPVISVGGPANLQGLLRGSTKRRFRWRRIQTLVYRNSDFSEVPIGFYDAELDAECRLSPIGEGRFGCIPSSSRGVLLYTDPNCTNLVLDKSTRVDNTVESQACFDGPTRIYRTDLERGVVVETTATTPSAYQGPVFLLNVFGQCRNSVVQGELFEVSQREVDVAVFEPQSF